MKAEYRKELSHSSMILTGVGGGGDGYQLKILASNRIRGLLPVAEEHVDGETRLKYDITGLQPFAACCGNLPLTAEILKKLYGSLIDLFAGLEDYLLDPDHLLLDPDYLYTDWERGDLHAAYLPAQSAPVRESLIRLTEFLLGRTGGGDSRSVLLLCSVLGKLRGETFELGDLSSVLSSFGGETPEPGTVREGHFAEDIDRFLAGSGPGAEEEGGDFRIPDEIWDELAEDGAPPETAGRRAASGSFSGGGTGDPSGERGARRALRMLIPERYTVILALFMAMGAAVVWTAMRLQTEYILSVPERAAGAALGAAVICLCAKAADAAAGRKRRASGYAAEGGVFRESPGVPDTGAPRGNPGIPVGSVPWESSGFPDGIYEEGDYTGRNGPERSGLRGERYSGGLAENRGGDDFFAEGFPGETDDRVFPFRDGGRESAADDDGSGKTILLSDLGSSMRGIPATLVPVSKDSGLPPIILEERDLLIGKKKALADRVIPDPAVSRIHARISCRDGRYSVSDMGSKNGTAVNGKQAAGREELPLADGYHVLFAGCEYIFHEGSGISPSSRGSQLYPPL